MVKSWFIELKKRKMSSVSGNISFRKTWLEIV